MKYVLEMIIITLAMLWTCLSDDSDPFKAFVVILLSLIVINTM